MMYAMELKKDIGEVNATLQLGVSDPSLQMTHPKTSYPPSLQHLVYESRATGGKGGRGVPPTRRQKCSFGGHSVGTCIRVWLEPEEALTGSADVGIYIYITNHTQQSSILPDATKTR